MTFVLKSGDSGNVAKVDRDSRLFTRAVSEGPLEEAAAERGYAAFWASTFATSGADETTISIKNTDAKALHIERIFVAALAACKWTLFEVISGTAAGTELTPVNSDLGSAVVNNETSFGNAEVTGALTGNTMFIASTVADAMAEIYLEGSLILQNGDEIAISASAITTVYVNIIGFWVPE